MLPKHNAALRACINFRQVNMHIVNDAYLMRQIDNQLKAMAGSTVYTALDLTKRYHQLLLHHKSKPVTEFLTPYVL